MSNDPREPFTSQSPLAASCTAVRASGRAADCVIGLLAVALVLISAGGYLYRQQQATVDGEQLRLIVSGPSSLHAGVAATYTISTASIDGQPLSAQIEASIIEPDGKRLRVHNEPTDDRGQLSIVFAAELPLPPQVRLKVVAQHGDIRKEMDRPLNVESAAYVTQLDVDKPLYRPGETVYYRSLTLSRFALEPAPNAPMHFEIRDPKGKVVPRSSMDGAAQRGMASGAFKIPADQAAGRYTLVCRPAERTPRGPLPAPISAADAATKEYIRHFYIRPYPAETLSDAIPINLGNVEVTFYPEGGELTPDLENRVYFVARSALRRPLHLTGTIVAKGRGEEDGGDDVAAVETIIDGRGSFNLIPQTGKTYRLKVTRPSGVANQPTLPDVSAQRDVVLSVGPAVYAPEEPLALNVRSAKPGRPLVVAAYCRGVQIGQQRLVTQAGPSHANPIAIPLPPDAAGVMRLVLYDYGASPPAPIAERLVYRQPSRRLNVEIIGLQRQYAPGEKVDVSLAITNEHGEPAQATLTVAAVNSALWSLAEDPAPTVPTDFLLIDELEMPDLAGADSQISDGASGDVSAAVALDLLLATQAPRLLAKRDPPDKDEAVGPITYDRPPLLFDNMEEIRAKHETIVADHQAAQAKLLDTFTVLSFLSGLGLMLLVAMLGLMRIATGVHLWIAAIAASACCAIVGAILVATVRQSNRHDMPVVFASYAAPTAEANTEAFPAQGPTADQEMLAVQPYAYQGKAQPESPTTLFWNPMLITGPDGKAPVTFTLPDTAGSYRLLIDAHGGGRLGSKRAEIIVPAKP